MAQPRQMIRRTFVSLVLGTAVLAAGPAMADYTDQVKKQLRSQGFGRIEVSSTMLGRTRILASNKTGQREIILNPRTGEILRDMWTASSGGNGPVIAGSHDSGTNTSGGDDGGTDDGGSDDGGSDDGGSDDGGDDSGGDDNSGEGGDDSGGDDGGDDDGGDDSGGDDGGDDDGGDDSGGDDGGSDNSGEGGGDDGKDD